MTERRYTVPAKEIVFRLVRRCRGCGVTLWSKSDHPGPLGSLGPEMNGIPLFMIHPAVCEFTLETGFD